METVCKCSQATLLFRFHQNFCKIISNQQFEKMKNNIYLVMSKLTIWAIIEAYASRESMFTCNWNFQGRDKSENLPRERYGYFIVTDI